MHPRSHPSAHSPRAGGPGLATLLLHVEKTPLEYGRVATEAAKMMKWVDPGIELAACGSSARTMRTYGLWEDVVLEQCFDHVEYISLHTYLNDFKGETEALLASPI